MWREYRRHLFLCLCALLQLLAFWRTQIMGSGCVACLCFVFWACVILLFSIFVFEVHQNSSEINPEGAPKSSKSDSGSMSVLGAQKSASLLELLDFQGVPKSPLFEETDMKYTKTRSRRASWTKHDLCIGFWCQDGGISLYIERLPPLPPTPISTRVGEFCVVFCMCCSTRTALLC